ncbi:MAG: hypothetical protein JRJ20_07595 [Deltaproteobacteria bacterium]|nr:hypothetical protein [Deltaproteobacteria bacterium]MBW2144755.1 hypothetical protein [Deltaproteobacteria bacterium]
MNLFLREPIALFRLGEDKMDGDYKEELNGIKDDPLKHNEEFLKNHKELNLDRDLYYKITIEHIEKSCGCQVICNPHFNGISFYVENEYYQDAQDVIEKITEENRGREERLARKKVEVSKKVSRKFDERIAKCEHPNDNEFKFAENCLKTLRIEDYVQARDAEKYRQLYVKYSEYFKLVGWPEDVEGDAAKKYLNSSFVRGI